MKSTVNVFKLAASIASHLQVSDQPINESSPINHVVVFFLLENGELAEVFISECPLQDVEGTKCRL